MVAVPFKQVISCESEYLLYKSKMDSPGKKKLIKFYKSLTNTEVNWRQENIMLEVVVKLSAMHSGGRKRVLY